MHLDTTPPQKLKINLYEAKLVEAAVLAADPKTESELDSCLIGIRAYGPLVGRNLVDETIGLRPRLFRLLILPRLRTRASFQLA